MIICDPKECSGCMACMAACPVQAIQFTQDSHGFYVPEVDEQKCIQCGACQRVCANRSRMCCDAEPKVYAAWTKDAALRRQSSSGGIFSGIAGWVLKQNGYIFGAALDSTNTVRHICIHSAGELPKLRGSKYVQSWIGQSYTEAKKLLDADETVLFTGTPCQIAGLRSFLGQKEYPRLLTMDIVCHGAPSPRVFADYLEKQEQKAGSRIVSVSFRHKEPSWTHFSMKLDFENGSTYQQDVHHDPYLAGFVRDYINRGSCYSCKFANSNHPSDITAADFWSYVSYSREQRNDEKGISLVLVNTPRGRQVFDAIAEDYVVQERTLTEAKRGNRCLSRPSQRAAQADDFWNDYLRGDDFFDCAARYFPYKPTSTKHLISEEINRRYYLFPGFVKPVLNRLFRKK